MAWFWLICAGLLEVVWAVAMKKSHGLTRPVPAAVTVVTMLASFVMLAVAMRSLPLGTAYAMWTGIGVIGAFAAGVLVLGEAASTARVLAVVFILIGLVLLKVSRG